MIENKLNSDISFDLLGQVCKLCVQISIAIVFIYIIANFL